MKRLSLLFAAASLLAGTSASAVPKTDMKVTHRASIEGEWSAEPESRSEVSELPELIKIVFNDFDPTNDNVVQADDKSVRFEIYGYKSYQEINNLYNLNPRYMDTNTLAFTINSRVVPEISGDYSMALSIPEGAFINEVTNALSPEVYYTIIVKGSNDSKGITMVPADGSTVSEWPERFSITFEDCTPARNNFSTAVAMEATFNGERVRMNGWTFDTDTRTVTYKFRDAAPTEAGTLVMDFPEGAMMDEDYQECTPAFTYTVNYDPTPEVTFEVDGDPKNGSTVKSFPDTFCVTFKGAAKVALADGYEDLEFDATWNGKSVLSSLYARNSQGDSYWFLIKPGFGASSISGDGVFRLTLPKGFFVLNGNLPSPEVDYSFTVKSKEDVAPEITVTAVPENGTTVSELPEVFSLFFEGAETVEISEGAEDLEYSVKWNNENITGALRFDKAYGFEYRFSIVTRGMAGVDMTGDGVFSLSFPEGFFTINGAYPSPAVDYSFTVKKNVSTEGTPFFDLVEESYPILNSFVNEGDSLDMMIFSLNQQLSVNSSCAKPIELFNIDIPKAIASIKAVAGEDDPQVMIDETEAIFIFSMEQNQFKEPGTYRVHVPQGFFLAEDGTAIAESNAYFQIGVGEWTPADGTTVDLSGTDNTVVNSSKKWYRMVLNPKGSIEPNGTIYPEEGDPIPGLSVPAVLTDSEGNVVESIVADNVQPSRGSWVLRFAKPIDKNGEYTLSVPKGFFICDLNGTRAEAPAMTITVNVIGGDFVEQIYTLSPEAGAYQIFPTITITYSDVKAIELPAGATVTMTMSNTETNLIFDVTAEENVVTLTPKTEFKDYRSEQTVYSVKVPAGLYTLVYNDGQKVANNEIVIDRYKINPLPVPVFSPQDNSTVPSLQTFVIETKTEIVNRFELTKNIKIYEVVNGIRGEQIGTFKNRVVENYDTEDCKLSFTASVTIPDGEYEVDVPSGYYKVPVYNEEGEITTQLSSVGYVLHYKVDSSTLVNEISNGGMAVDVYTVTGLRVLENAEPELLKALPAGMYIVNGKKIIIR